MDLKRRAGAAALLTVLLAVGLGLAAYRPRLVPDLRPGSRVGAAPAAYGEHGARTGVFGVGADAPGDPDAKPAFAAEQADGSRFGAPGLRDALADAVSVAAGRAPSARAYDAARLRNEWLEAVADAEARTAREAVSRPEPRSGKASGPRAAARSRVFSASALGTPMFAGLATMEGSSRDEEGEDDELDAPGPPGARSAGGRARWARRGARGFPLFRPPRRAVVRPSATTGRRVRPVRLSKLLGRGALRPPNRSIVPPDLSRLDARKPKGSPAAPASPADVEARDPRKLGAACRRRGGHWDGALWHDGAARGVAAEERWLWLWKVGTRWWARGAAEKPPFLRHKILWWSKQKGVWFALHEGELWSWRRFDRWDAEGLIRLIDGVEIVYSADFTMAAVITPGAGAVLYDARTGAELGSWLESEMPRRRPRAPQRLRLPSGI